MHNPENRNHPCNHIDVLDQSTAYVGIHPADNVGPDNVDNIAISDVIQELNLDIDGLPTLRSNPTLPRTIDRHNNSAIMPDRIFGKVRPFRDSTSS